LQQRQEYNDSVNRIFQQVWTEEQTGMKKPQEPLEKVKIGRVDPWIVESAKEVGLDVEGYEHEISNYFIRHVMKNHGNAKKEASRGNLPIQEQDFEHIPVLIEHPTYTIFGAKRNNEDRIIYIQAQANGTMLYFEEVLTGKSNRSLRGNTMYKMKAILEKDEIIAHLTINGKTDVSGIKITGMDGGQTINTANHEG
jgi:hypothetical protein